MANNPKEAQPTQKFIEVKGVKNGVLILKNGGLRQILMVSGMNFDLKSQEEQEAITFSYQNFLNSLNFSIQIFIHSRKINIESYLEALGKTENQEVNPLLRTQISEYREFIRSFVQENAIMSKTFFVVVPFDPVEIPGTSEGGIFSKLIGGSKKPSAQALAAQEKSLSQHLGQLQQRTDQIISGLGQVGLRAVSLNDDETIELFYNLYNPETVEKKGLDLLATGTNNK